MPSEEYLMLAQHPVSEDADAAAEQISGTIDALVQNGRRVLVIYPNADAGGRHIIEVIEKRCVRPQFTCFRSIPRSDYLSLLSRAAALVGNSSSGLVEAPSLGTPFVNVGDRQKGRERGDNVIDVGYGREEVLRGLREIADPEFLSKVRGKRNPYGDGKSGERIAELLAKVPLPDGVTQKHFCYMP
jgi:UDP-hydrolysing UDP-N-acetyl-D-glucosamine 2-epimerase